MASIIPPIISHKEAINVFPITAPLIASLRETARLLSTHYSTQIEGNMLTQSEVKQVVEGRKAGFPRRERDEREVKNYFKGLEYVEQELKKDRIFNQGLIKTIHSLVLVGTKKGTPYREGQNVIRDGASGGIVYMPPEGPDVTPLMSGLVDWIKDVVLKKESNISEEDLDLFKIVDTAEEAMDYIKEKIDTSDTNF